MSDYKIVRTYSAGVFAGKIESREGKEVVKREAIRRERQNGFRVNLEDDHES